MPSRKINFALQPSQNKFGTKSLRENKFGTKIGPSIFIDMTLFLEMRPLVQDRSPFSQPAKSGGGD